MTSRTLRASAVFVALAATTSACLLAPASTAAAATTVETAASALGLSPNTYSVTEVPASGDITKALISAVKLAGSSSRARVVHLPAGHVSVSSTIRVPNRVYLVAEPGTTVTWKGKDPNFLRFAPATGASLTSGVYGGTWNGAHRASTTVVSVSNATVRLVQLAVTGADKHGIAAYDDSLLTLLNMSSTTNDFHGVYVEKSRLVASGVIATGNWQNGVQLSRDSSGAITGSSLNSNGRGVKGSTTGKIGHGLGVGFDSTATVSSSSMSSNKVCGVSLSGTSKATISSSHLDNNGRHGLGTTAGTTATISDSTVTGNGYHGVLSSGRGTHVTLNGATISRSARSGVSVPTRGKLTVGSGNTFSSNRSHGITASGRGSVTISGSGNVVTSNRGDGLRLTGSGTRGRITKSVSFLNNRGSAIVVSRAKLAMVPCSYSGNDKKIEKRAGGKVSTLS